MIGKCIDCGGKWRQLDRWGNCIKGHRSIVTRRLRYPNARRMKGAV
jgi:hypothetical protein